MRAKSNLSSKEKTTRKGMHTGRYVMCSRERTPWLSVLLTELYTLAQPCAISISRNGASEDALPGLKLTGLETSV